MGKSVAAEKKVRRLGNEFGAFAVLGRFGSFGISTRRTTLSHTHHLPGMFKCYISLPCKLGLKPVRVKLSLVEMALLVVRSAGSGRVLAEFDGDEFQGMVEAHGNTVRALKLQLKSKGFGGRFQLKFLNGSAEMQDDEVLVPPLDLNLVSLTFLPFDESETKTFIEACGAGRLGEVETRLQKLQDPNAPDAAVWWTALHSAAENGHLEVVRLLLEAGAFCDQATTDDGTTPLILAALEGHLEVARLLLEAGASCDKAATDDGSTALIQAAEDGHLEMVHLLLEAGASCDQAKTSDGTTPLIFAAQNGHLQVVRLLLLAGASCDKARTSDEATALILASFNGYFGVVRLLLHLEVARLLLEAGASCDMARTSDGATALDCAAQSGHTEIVRLLESIVRREKRRKVTT